MDSASRYGGGEGKQQLSNKDIPQPNLLANDTPASGTGPGFRENACGSLEIVSVFILGKEVTTASKWAIEETRCTIVSDKIITGKPSLDREGKKSSQDKFMVYKATVLIKFNVNWAICQEK